MEKHFSRGQVSKSLSALRDTSSGYSRYHQEICHIYSLLLWIYSQGVISFQAHQKQLQPLCIFHSLDCRGSTRLTFHLLALNYFASTHSSSKSSCVGCPVSAHSYPLPACPAPSPIFSGHSKHCSWKFSVRLILHGFCFLHCSTVLKEKKKWGSGVDGIPNSTVPLGAVLIKTQQGRLEMRLVYAGGLALPLQAKNYVVCGVCSCLQAALSGETSQIKPPWSSFHSSCVFH